MGSTTDVGGATAKVFSLAYSFPGRSGLWAPWGCLLDKVWHDKGP